MEYIVYGIMIWLVCKKLLRSVSFEMYDISTVRDQDSQLMGRMFNKLCFIVSEFLTK